MKSRFWLGLTVGRFVLGFVTPRLGENFSIILYLLGAIVSQLIFWLVPSFVGSSIAVAFVGFLLGPLFPAAIVALTKLLPKHMHVPAIGFAAAFGGGGACVLPLASVPLPRGRVCRYCSPSSWRHCWWQHCYGRSECLGSREGMMTISLDESQKLGKERVERSAEGVLPLFEYWKFILSAHEGIEESWCANRTASKGGNSVNCRTICSLGFDARRTLPSRSSEKKPCNTMSLSPSDWYDLGMILTTPAMGCMGDASKLPGTYCKGSYGDQAFTLWVVDPFDRPQKDY